MRVGFAGLGRMGVHMGRNLVEAGHEVTVWTRSVGKAASFAAETGCGVAATPAELMRATDVVVTMLADDPASLELHLGADGLFTATGAGIIVEMGTMSPAHIRDLAAQAPDGVQIIDAPVSGATQAAQAGTLMIMAGCTEDQAAPLRGLFDAMGQKTLCLGASGAGAVMKLAVNSMIHGINQNFAEAMTLAEASGIRAETAFDVIEASAACPPMLKYRRPIYLDDSSHDVTFTVSLARKDMEVTVALAEAGGVAIPLGRTTLTKLKQAEAEGYGARDMAAMLAFMRKEKP